jgi:hypothetical protein
VVIEMTRINLNHALPHHPAYQMCQDSMNPTVL